MGIHSLSLGILKILLYLQSGSDIIEVPVFGNC